MQVIFKLKIFTELFITKSTNLLPGKNLIVRIKGHLEH